MFRRIEAVDRNTRTVGIERAIDAGLFEKLHNGSAVVRRDGVLQDVPGHGPIHRAGVDVSETDLPREFARHAALARRRRAINRNDLMIRRSHGSSFLVHFGRRERTDHGSR